MSLLKELLMKKKVFEAEQEIEDFMLENDIPQESIVHKIMFKKSIFDLDQVNDFLEANWISGFGEIKEENGVYESIIFDEIAFINDTFQDVELREGIIIVVGLLKPMAYDNPVLFSDKPSKNYKFSDDHPYIIELAKVVKGFHVNYGPVEITKDDLLSFKNNFENNVVGVDLSIDFDHETREAAGWVKDVFLNEDGTVLYGAVRWTPKGALALSNREFRYFSPEFNRNYVHPHTGAEHGPTLLGGGLVNRPFLKMDAIVSLKNQKEGDTHVDTIKMSEHKAKVTELEKEISDLKLSENTAKSALNTLKDKHSALEAEVTQLKEDKAKKEKEAKHNQLFNEGKINKAQLDALNEGKDLIDVLSLSEKMNTKPAGNDGKPATDITGLTDEEIKFCEKHGYSLQEYVEANKGGH